MPYTAAQLTQYYTSVAGTGPDTATQTLIQVYANQNASGTRSDASTLALVLNSPQAQNTTDVAIATYQFFTGAAPSVAGLAYLRGDAGTGNTSGLNTVYYNGSTGVASAPSAGGFNMENRYYNFSLALAFGNTAANTNFVNTYGTLTFAQTVQIAYEAIVGSPNVGSATATAAIANITASLPYFQQIAQQRSGFGASITPTQFDLATKAVAIGYILEEAVKADVGTYAKAIDQFNASTAAGTNSFDQVAAGVNILTTFAPGGAGFGTGVGASATLTPTTLLVGQDNITAGSSLAISGVVDTNTAANSTLTAIDNIAPNGNGNTLSVTYTGTAAANAANGAVVTGVQTFNIKNLSTGLVTLDASTVGGVTAVNSNLSTGVVTVTNLATGASAGIIGNNVANNGSLNLGYATNSDAATINLSGGVGGAANPTVTITSAPTAVTVNSSGSGVVNSLNNLVLGGAAKSLTINSSNNLATGNITGFTGTTSTITVLGSATNVNLGTIEAATVKTINASGLTAGGVTATLNTIATQSFTGGQGADKVTLSAAATGGSIDGGAGTDTIAINTSAFLTAASGAFYKNFEVLELGNGVTADVSQLNATNPTLAGLVFDATATVTNANAAQAGNITQVATGTINVGITGASLAGQIDTVKITANDGAAAVSTVVLAAPTLTGVENLQLVANPDSITVSALTNATSLTSITGATATGTTLTLTDVSAATALTSITLSGAGTAVVTTGATTATNLVIDGSAATGNLTITGTGATNGLKIIGGSGTTDTLLGGTGGDVITGNNGTNNITGAGGADVLSGGTGVDTYITATAADTRNTSFALTNTTAANIDSITNFVAGAATGHDVVNFGLGATAFGAGLTFTGATTSTVTAVTVGTAATFADLTAGIGAGVASTSAAAQFYDVTVSGGALAGHYLILNDATAAYGANDTIINITGVTGAVVSADITFS